MFQYNEFRKQVVENEKKQCQNLTEKDEQLACLQQQLQEAKNQTEQSRKDTENRMRAAVGDKEKKNFCSACRITEICEQRPLALQGTADKEREIVSAMEAQEEAQWATEEVCQAASATRDKAAQLEESRKKAEDDKNRALNSLNAGRLHSWWSIQQGNDTSSGKT